LDTVDWASFDVVDVPNDVPEAHQEAYCMNCELEFNDVYTLTGYNYQQTQEGPTKCTITGKPEPDDDHDIYDMMAKAAAKETPMSCVIEDPRYAEGKSDLFVKEATAEGMTVLEIRLSEQPDWDALLEFIETVKAGLTEEPKQDRSEKARDELLSALEENGFDVLDSRIFDSNDLETFWNCIELIRKGPTCE
jgi:hypothetical protein